MTRTEIEDYVKARSTFLTSHKHIIPESSGRKMKFKVTERDVEMFLNIREDKKQHTATLYSITKEIKMPPT